MNKITSVCVYSASSTKIDPVYFDAARELGTLLGQRHIRLVNGAGNMGLMAAVADATLAAGGEVTGVIPRFMIEQGYNAAGDKLIASYREKHYSTNTPLERFVVEELIAGPSGQIEGLYPVINPETKIVNILTKDGICYVNLDSNFLTVINNVSTEVAVYSIVNSLVELDNINKVQILVNGEVPPTFSNSTFERNLDYVTTLEQ